MHRALMRAATLPFDRELASDHAMHEASLVDNDTIAFIAVIMTQYEYRRLL